MFMVIFGVGAVVFVSCHARLPLVDAFAVCLGIGFGGGVVCLMAVLGNYYGLKAFALLSGIAIAINTTLSALAPYIAGSCSIAVMATWASATSSPAGVSSERSCCS